MLGPAGGHVLRNPNTPKSTGKGLCRPHVNDSKLLFITAVPNTLCSSCISGCLRTRYSDKAVRVGRCTLYFVVMYAYYYYYCQI